MRTMGLKRIAQNDDGTFGVLIDGMVTPFALTLENRWRNNEKNISCIPEGWYICKRIISPRFGETFQITEVPGRSHILFHWGNLDDDTQGCVLLGEEFGVLGGETAILSSKRAFKEFMTRLDGLDKFALNVVWV